jgi:tripartite-type tricarboxylate transporter receptor subunit TctC
MRLRGIVCITALLIEMAVTVPVQAAAAVPEQAYPNKPIRLVEPQAAGSSVDVVARMIAERLTGILGQQVIVDNRAGASGLIGSELVAKAPRDGYTLLVGNVGPITILPSLYKKMPYDPLKDFAPVSQETALPFVLFVSASLPVNSVKELVALAKAQPGKLNYGSGGVGGGLHLVAEMFAHIAGVNIVHVPYKDINQLVPEMSTGRVQMTFYTIPNFLPHVKAGRMKVLVIASRKRFPLLPQVPTSVEVGMPDLIASSWHGILAPAGTPPAVIRKLNQAIVKALAAPDLRENLVNQGAEVVGSSPEQFARFLREDLERWRKVITDAGVKAE